MTTDNPVTFTDAEIKAMQKEPAVLRALADYHDLQATMAEGMDFTECVTTHEARRKELLAAAEKIEASY